MLYEPREMDCTCSFQLAKRILAFQSHVHRVQVNLVTSIAPDTHAEDKYRCS